MFFNARGWVWDGRDGVTQTLEAEHCAGPARSDHFFSVLAVPYIWYIYSFFAGIVPFLPGAIYFRTFSPPYEELLRKPLMPLPGPRCCPWWRRPQYSDYPI